MDQPGAAVRGLHGWVRRGDGAGAAAHQLRGAQRGLGGVRTPHRGQLLPHVHHPGRAHSHRPLHQRLRTPAARSGCC